MGTDRSPHDAAEQDGALGLPSSGETGAEQPTAWEQIENGRYRPRRIRGSFRGRELG